MVADSKIRTECVYQKKERMEDKTHSQQLEKVRNEEGMVEKNETARMHKERWGTEDKIVEAMPRQDSYMHMAPGLWAAWTRIPGTGTFIGNHEEDGLHGPKTRCREVREEWVTGLLAAKRKAQTHLRGGRASICGPID
jgi:hypothetical protein